MRASPSRLRRPQIFKWSGDALEYLRTWPPVIPPKLRDTSSRATYPHGPCDGSLKNDRPRSDWPSPACPQGRREWRAVYLSGMTLFSSVRLADNPLCTLSARKTSAEALGPQVN